MYRGTWLESDEKSVEIESKREEEKERVTHNRKD
jgi:hypothetical protein